MVLALHDRILVAAVRCLCKVPLQNASDADVRMLDKGASLW